MKSLAALLVGLRQLFSWRGTPRPSPRSLHDSSHCALRDYPDHCDRKSNHNESGEQTEKFADLRRFLTQHEIVDCTPLSDADLETHSSGLSETYTYHRLREGTVALGLISWHHKDHAFEYVKQMIILVDIETDETIYKIEGPAEQIKPVCVKLISFLKKK